jgi:Domain of unknown function (DUF4148)
MAYGNRGIKLNELYPRRHPAKPVHSSVTREQVQAELAEAIRTGDFIVSGESGRKGNEVHPDMPADRVILGLRDAAHAGVRQPRPAVIRIGSLPFS